MYILHNINKYRVSERGRTKCGQYWPISEGTAVQYAYFTIATTAVNTSEDYTITCISLLNRIVRVHLHYHTDHRVLSPLL